MNIQCILLNLRRIECIGPVLCMKIHRVISDDVDVRDVPEMGRVTLNYDVIQLVK